MVGTSFPFPPERASRAPYAVGSLGPLQHKVVVLAALLGFEGFRRRALRRVAELELVPVELEDALGLRPRAERALGDDELDADGLALGVQVVLHHEGLIGALEREGFLGDGDGLALEMV